MRISFGGGREGEICRCVEGCWRSACGKGESLGITYGAENSDDGFHGRPDCDSDKVPWTCLVSWVTWNANMMERCCKHERLTGDVAVISLSERDHANNTDNADAVFWDQPKLWGRT